MRPGSFRYLVRQGWKNMGANRLMTLAGIGVLTACFIVTGAAALLTLNVNEVVDLLSEEQEITVMILPEVDDAAAAALESEIRAIPYVREVSFVSKQDAFLQMREMLGENMLVGFDDVFPALYRVQIDEPSNMEDAERLLMALPGVEYTEAPVGLAEVMVTVRDAVAYFGWGLVLVLAAVSVIIVSNTIRLTVFARRKEISIMKYVGATNAFIRLPFFVEGMTVGVIAGLLGGGIICGAYYLIYSFLRDMTNIWVMGIMSRVLLPESIWAYVVGAAVAAGATLGGLGTGMSVRRHLKV